MKSFDNEKIKNKMSCFLSSFIFKGYLHNKRKK